MTTSAGATWIVRAEEALARTRGGGGEDEAHGEIEVLRGQRPPLLDATATRALLALPMAALVWAAVVLRAQIAEDPLDPIGVLLRVLALGLSVRAVLLGAEMAKRLKTWAESAGYALAIAPEGVLFRSPRGDVVAPREDVVDVRERGDWRTRQGARRWSEVYLVTRPVAGRGWIAIPPLFERTPGVLAERLMRWRGPIATPEEPAWPDPPRLGSQVYDDAAAGRIPEGGLAIAHGLGWLQSGPYATVLLAAVVIDAFVRLPREAWAALGLGWPIALAITLLSIPAVWIWMTRREVSPRKGLACVLTPAEILMRTRAGVLRVSWKRMTRVHVASRAKWTILRGYHQARQLVIERSDGPPIRYDESFLGAPAEAVQALCEAYKRGVLSPALPADPA